MFMYYSGKLNLEDELILAFYTKSSDKIRGHALHYLGYSLYSDKGIAPEILERVRALCNVRLAAIKNATDKSVHRSELAAFGWWFASAKFDDTWSLSHLIRGSWIVAGDRGRSSCCRKVSSALESDAGGVR